MTQIAPHGNGAGFIFRLAYKVPIQHWHFIRNSAILQPMQLISSDAIILRHIDYGEADRIVTFFTPEHGRCKGFARSARKSRKRFGPGLEPFAKVLMHWSTSASGGLLTLREVDLLDLHVGLRSDLDAIALAGYGCELVEEMVGDDPGHPQIYRLLEAFLGQLAAVGGSASARLLFELRPRMS